MLTKTLNIQLNEEQIPYLPAEGGFHIHLDDLYEINPEGKIFLICREG